MAKLIFTVTHSKSLKQNKKLILMGEKSFIYEKNFASWNKLIFYEKKKRKKIPTASNPPFSQSTCNSS